MWCVCEFDDDDDENSLEIVPDSWINKKEMSTLWPPYRTDRKNMLAIENRENPNSTWKTSKIVRIHAEAGYHFTLLCML